METESKDAKQKQGYWVGDNCASAVSSMATSVPTGYHMPILPHSEFVVLSFVEELFKFIISIVWAWKTNTAVLCVFLYQVARSWSTLLRLVSVILLGKSFPEKITKIPQIIALLTTLAFIGLLSIMQGCSTREGWTDIKFNGSCEKKCEATCPSRHPYEAKYFGKSCDDLVLLQELRPGFLSFNDETSTCTSDLTAGCDCTGCSCSSRYSYFHNGGDPENPGPHSFRSSCPEVWEITDEKLCFDSSLKKTPSAEFVKISIPTDDGSPRCHINSTGVYFNSNASTGRNCTLPTECVCLPRYFSMSSGYCRTPTPLSRCADAFREISGVSKDVEIVIDETFDRQIPVGCSFSDDFHPLEQLDVVKIFYRALDDRHTLAPCNPRAKCVCQSGTDLNLPPISRSSVDLSDVVDSANLMICLLVMIAVFTALEIFDERILKGVEKPRNPNNVPDSCDGTESSVVPMSVEDTKEEEDDENPKENNIIFWIYLVAIFLAIVLPLIVGLSTTQLNLRVEEGYASSTSKGSDVVFQLFVGLDIILSTSDRLFTIFGDAIAVRQFAISCCICVAIPGMLIVSVLDYSSTYGLGGGTIIESINGNSETILLFSLFTAVWSGVTFLKYMFVTLTIYKDDDDEDDDSEPKLERPLLSKLPAFLRYGFKFCNDVDPEAVGCTQFGFSVTKNKRTK